MSCMSFWLLGSYIVGFKIGLDLLLDQIGSDPTVCISDLHYLKFRAQEQLYSLMLFNYTVVWQKVVRNYCFQMQIELNHLFAAPFMV